MNDILGWFGMVATLLSVLSANYFKGVYNPLVIAGGIALAVNSYVLGAWHFVVLNVVFVCLGVTGMVTEYVQWRNNDKK